MTHAGIVVSSLALLAWPAPEAAGTGPAVESAAHAAPDTLVDAPFELIRNQIVLEVTAAGRGPLRVLLDTAGEPSAVDLATAREHGFPLDTTASGEASGVGRERVRIFAATLPDVEIAGTPVGDLDAVALDLSRIGERMGGRIDGILGYGLLAGRLVQIDYPARRFRIFDGPVPKPPHVAPLRFQEGGHQPVVEIDVDGRTVAVTLDTGSSLSLELYEKEVERLGLTDALAGARADTVLGARGAAVSRRARLPAVGLGPWTVRDVEVGFRDGGEDDRGGNLGNGILREFVLTIDYPGEWIGFDHRGAD